MFTVTVPFVKKCDGDKKKIADFGEDLPVVFLLYRVFAFIVSKTKQKTKNC